MKRRKVTRNPAAVSEQVRSIIAARRLTPYAVAVAAGLAPSVLTRFVNGERGLTLDSFDRVAAALGLRLAEASRRGKALPRVGTAGEGPV